MSQLDIIEDLIKEFDDELEKCKPIEMPMTMGVKIKRDATDETKMTEEKQTKFRSVIGTLLYLVKHSRPDISNAVRPRPSPVLAR